MKDVGVIFWLITFVLLGILLPLLPQVVGFISYLLFKKHNDLVAHVLGVIIPPVSSFYLYKRLFSVDFNAVDQRVSLLFLGSFIYLFFSLLIQLAIHNRHKLKAGEAA